MDAHPAGAQIFLKAWAHFGELLGSLNGTIEWWIKAPFLASSIAGLVAVVFLARRWFGAPRLALPCSFRTLQWTLLFASVARPYALGMVCAWCLPLWPLRQRKAREWTWGCWRPVLHTSSFWWDCKRPCSDVFCCLGLNRSEAHCSTFLCTASPCPGSPTGSRWPRFISPGARCTLRLEVCEVAPQRLLALLLVVAATVWAVAFCT